MDKLHTYQESELRSDMYYAIREKQILPLFFKEEIINALDPSMFIALTKAPVGTSLHTFPFELIRTKTCIQVNFVVDFVQLMAQKYHYAGINHMSQDVPKVYIALVKECKDKGEDGKVMISYYSEISPAGNTINDLAFTLIGTGAYSIAAPQVGYDSVSFSRNFEHPSRKIETLPQEICRLFAAYAEVIENMFLYKSIG